MKKVLAFICCLFLLTACQGKEQAYQTDYYDAFDTVISVMLPANDQEDAEKKMERVHQEYLRLHKLYDNYHTYPGLNNVKTINDAAGDHPVKVEKDLYDLVEKSIENYHTKAQNVNIAMGSVLKIWSDYREGHEAGADISGEDPSHKEEPAQVPPMENLKEAANHGNIDDIVLNEKDQSIYLKDPKMALDLGAVAKGYATEKVAQFIKEDLKIDSALISAGGNVRALGKPVEADRENFIIGLQNPEAIGGDGQEESNVFDRFAVQDCSVVTSGDYQRYYLVDGKKYHHLIDPKTLMPGDYFRSVTIVTKDSGMADFLSTAVFLMPYEEGRKLVDSMDGVEAYWIFPDLSVKYTKGFEQIRQEQE